MAEQFTYGAEEARFARNSVDTALHSRPAFSEWIGAIERAFPALAKTAARLFRYGVEEFRDQTSRNAHDVTAHLEEGALYIAKRVRRRPATYTFAGMGVGLFLGLLLSARLR
jgi:hypothetical protein